MVREGQDAHKPSRGRLTTFSAFTFLWLASPFHHCLLTAGGLLRLLQAQIRQNLSARHLLERRGLPLAHPPQYENPLAQIPRLRQQNYDDRDSRLFVTVWA